MNKHKSKLKIFSDHINNFRNHLKVRIIIQLFKINISDKHNAFIYLLNGEIKVGTKKHKKTENSNLILLNKGNYLDVIANKKSEFLFIAGKPIGEPIARGGPFVMNTKEEVIQAIEDYKNGTFAKY